MELEKNKLLAEANEFDDELDDFEEEVQTEIDEGESTELDAKLEVVAEFEKYVTTCKKKVEEMGKAFIKIETEVEKLK